MRSTRPTPFRRRPGPRALLLLVVLGTAGCATLGEPAQTLVPTRYQTRTGPYAVFTNFPIAADAPAIRHLQSLDRQLEATLGMRIDPGDHPIEVYILNDRKAFSHFLTFYYPELPPRRAFFLAQGDRRVVYTFLGDRLDEDLRHEATHALLHVAMAEIPLWLDEGLAEYFEGPEERGGVNAEHLGRLPQDRAQGWAPDLVRLESLKDVRQMSPRDYRESWGWVHYLLHGPPAGKTALIAYLNELRTNPGAGPLSGRLEAVDAGRDMRLIAHLDKVRDRAMAAAPPTADAEGTVRLQNTSAEPMPAAAPRRSFFGRIRDLFSS
jgi:hypothetical protein